MHRLALLTLVAFACDCSRKPSPPERGASPATAAPTAVAPSAISKRTQREVEPTTLLTLPMAAFHVSLQADDEAIYLLTSNAAYRFLPDAEPQRIKLDLGEGPIMTRSAFVYWSEGAVWRAPKRGEPAEKLASVPHRPQSFATSGDHFVWLDRSEQGRFSIQTLKGGKRRTVHAVSGKIDALTMIQDWVFFVERAADNTWRFGGVRKAGGEVVYSSVRSGRTPSMLAAADDIFYFDSNLIELRKMSPDFQRDEVLLENFVCSPISVSNRIHCGQVEGLVEVSLTSPKPRLLSPGRGSSVTSIVADAKRVVWVIDAGADKLAVRMLPLRAMGGLAAP